MKVRYLLVVLAVFSAVSFATETKELSDQETLEKICSEQLCRGGSVGLITNDGSSFAVDFEIPLPIVQDGWVSIFPGDTLYVEGTDSGDSLTDLTAVKEIQDPDRTLIIRFWQEKREDEGMMMLLSIQNPFERPIKYHAGMMFPEDDDAGLRKTSSCPVLGNGKSAYEMWPDAIFQLVLFDFRFLPSDLEEMTCEF